MAQGQAIWSGCCTRNEQGIMPEQPINDRRKALLQMEKEGRQFYPTRNPHLHQNDTRRKRKQQNTAKTQRHLTKQIQSNRTNAMVCHYALSMIFPPDQKIDHGSSKCPLPCLPGQTLRWLLHLHLILDMHVVRAANQKPILGVVVILFAKAALHVPRRRG